MERGRRRLATTIVAALLLLGAVALGRYLVVAVPGGTGMAAKHLCSLVFVSRLEPRRATSIYVEPAIFPLGLFLRYEVDRKERTVRTISFGGLARAEAAHRPGCGCTVLHEATADVLRADFRPPSRPPAGPPREIDREHRARVFDEAELERAVAGAFAEPDDGGRNTLAVVVLHDGRLVAETYAPGVDATTPLTGWSMAKSVAATLAGILVRQGRLDVHAPTGFPEWSAQDDPRRAITPNQLLRMTSGLEITENQSGSDPNTVMLFLRRDAAAYAASRPLYTSPDTHWNYMSGSTILVSRLVREAVGGTLASTHAFLRDELLDPLGMTTATPEYDESGTFIGSSFMLASARDWARFGQLYLQGGSWEGRPVVTREWVDYVTTPTALSPDGIYGAGFWLNTERKIWPTLPADAFAAQGFQGQITTIVPSLSLVVVRLGASSGDSGRKDIAGDVAASLRQRIP